MIDKGLSERHALRIVGMSASAYRYQAQPDRNVALRRRIVELAQRHKRYGVGMIHLKLRQEGDKPVNYKRVERLYREERLQVRRRKRKKIPVSERQPLFRPSAPNEVWSHPVERRQLRLRERHAKNAVAFIRRHLQKCPRGAPGSASVSALLTRMRHVQAQLSHRDLLQSD